MIRAAPPHWPYTHHRTMAQVMEQEDLDRFRRLPRVLAKDRKLEDFA